MTSKILPYYARVRSTIYQPTQCLHSLWSCDFLPQACVPCLLLPKERVDHVTVREWTSSTATRPTTPPGLQQLNSSSSARLFLLHAPTPLYHHPCALPNDPCCPLLPMNPLYVASSRVRIRSPHQKVLIMNLKWKDSKSSSFGQVSKTKWRYNLKYGRTAYIFNVRRNSPGES